MQLAVTVTENEIIVKAAGEEHRLMKDPAGNGVWIVSEDNVQLCDGFEVALFELAAEEHCHQQLNLPSREERYRRAIERSNQLLTEHS